MPVWPLVVVVALAARHTFGREGADFAVFLAKRSEGRAEPLTEKERAVLLPIVDDCELTIARMLKSRDDARVLEGPRTKRRIHPLWAER